MKYSVKVGDKVYCKKNYNFNNSFFSQSFIKNKTYTIDYIGEDIDQYEKISNDHSAYCTINKIIFLFLEGEYLSPLFKEYFISIKESRKLKLQKINEIQ